MDRGELICADERCPALGVGTMPSNTTYTLRAGRISSETIPLAATTDGEVRTVHRFVDNAYVGTGRPDVPVSWTPGRSGEFTVRAVDDQGRADSRTLQVAVVQ